MNGLRVLVVYRHDDLRELIRKIVEKYASHRGLSITVDSTGDIELLPAKLSDSSNGNARLVVLYAHYQSVEVMLRLIKDDFPDTRVILVCTINLEYDLRSLNFPEGNLVSLLLPFTPDQLSILIGNAL